MATSPLLSRADCVMLGDYIAVRDHDNNPVILRVNSLEVTGEDVTINKRITISGGNMVVCLGKAFIVATN